MIPRSRFGAGAAALWAGVGAVAAWLALSWLENGSAASDAPASRDAATAGRVPAEAAAETIDASGQAAPAPALERRSDAPRAENLEPAAPPNAGARPKPIVADAPPSNSPATRTDLPNRRDGDPAGRNPAAALLDALRITCDFGAGNNTGLRYGDLLTVGGGAQWGGGLLTYDLGDAGAGTARLTGSPPATGSPSGEAEVQVTTEGTRVFLSGFLENREFVVVTIFDEVDHVGRHIAVMSRHDGSFSYASQFLGTCE